MNYSLHFSLMPWDMGRLYEHELDALDAQIERWRKESQSG